MDADAILAPSSGAQHVRLGARTGAPAKYQKAEGLTLSEADQSAITRHLAAVVQ
jgi:hypothetical protein